MGAQDPPGARHQPPSEPRRLGGRYEVGAVLGYGGMAEVRKATDLRLGRTVAVKLLRGELTESPAFQERFRREARAVAALNHPAIVGVYDAGEETIDGVDTFYIVMEYVEGHTLRSLLRSGPQSPNGALEITAAVLAALEEIHQRGIVHRDIKPANVMVTPTGTVKVMDFGIARAVAEESAVLTQTAAVIGTAHYLSPEQARGDSADARSDVYSTGCLLYELLTGRPPFVGDSAIAVAYQHVREAPRPPSALAPGVPSDVDSIVLAALAKQPDQRYQSARQLRDAITAVLAGEQAPVPVVPVEITADLPFITQPVKPAPTMQSPVAELDAAGSAAAGRPPRRARLVVASAAALLVVGLGGLALTTIGDDPDSGQTGRRSAHSDEGGPGATRRAQTERTEEAGSTVVDPTPPSQRRPPQSAGDARFGAAIDDDRRDAAAQNSRSADPTADPETGTSEAPTSTSTADPTTPQGTQPDSEPSPTTSPEPTTSDSPADSPQPEPTTTQEPPATPTTSPDGSSSAP